MATVTFIVTPDPDSTYALKDAFTLDEDGTLSVESPGVLANDHDPAGQALSALLVSGPSHGSLMSCQEKISTGDSKRP